MATEHEKEQLMETLKFTPRKYKIEIWGYGGEVYWGEVDRKIYDFFKSKSIDIGQYASDWDDSMWTDIPDEMRPFEPGAAYDCDHGCHLSGATFDSGSYVTVYDETGEKVWQSSLDSVELAGHGVGFECVDERYINEYEEGTVVFYGAQGEKGLFFGNEFELRSPFDPSKLQINYEDCDGWALTSGVSYDGEDIDGNDYDTSGKWGDARWIIVGDEEVYDGVERDQESYEDTSDDNEEITLDEDWDPAAELDKIEVPIQDGDSEPLDDPKGKWPF